MDIIFLLDTSCVGDNDFSRVKKFISAFVENLTAIGPQDNQVGVITFADDAKVAFRLGQYNTFNEINSSIYALPLGGGKANFAEGLCHLREGFRKENGARPVSEKVLRVAIIISAGNVGKSNTKQCRVDDTTYIEEAEMLHNPRHKIDVYAIGITDNINYEVLNAIASKPSCEYVTNIDAYHRLQYIATFIDDICRRGKPQLYLYIMLL